MSTTKLKLAKERAARYRDMLPTRAQSNDPDSFTAEDLDILIRADDLVEAISADDLRHNMTVTLIVYYRRYLDKLTGRKRPEPDQTGKIVEHLTRGWDDYIIVRPKIGYRGVSPLQDFVEDLLGTEGVKPLD
ncbi:MAG: hypothetical protein QHC67_01265 [Sphingobium sp.]|uniref:hypothetical protein n=1 Tax=Sphingobium sp. TaxID=1912891 RepID=UPI0029AA3D5D|nr:hypothetical protein [Sphingobium sp.]MDX3908437.1 hypothetical protein [Sphingobium sp.]